MCLALKGSVSWASAARGPPSETRYSTRQECGCGISQSPWTSCCPPCHSKSDWPKVFTRVLGMKCCPSVRKGPCENLRATSDLFRRRCVVVVVVVVEQGA